MKFDYGDEVVVTRTDKDGPASMHLKGSVVAITNVSSESESDVFGYPVGTVLYTVEFADGSDDLLPEESLRAM